MPEGTIFEPLLEGCEGFFAQGLCVEVERLPPHLMFDLCAEVPGKEASSIPQHPVDKGEGDRSQIYKIKSIFLKDSLEPFREIEQFFKRQLVVRQDGYIQIAQHRGILRGIRAEDIAQQEPEVLTELLNEGLHLTEIQGLPCSRLLDREKVHSCFPFCLIPCFPVIHGLGKNSDKRLHA